MYPMLQMTKTHKEVQIHLRRPQNQNSSFLQKPLRHTRLQPQQLKKTSLFSYVQNLVDDKCGLNKFRLKPVFSPQLENHTTKIPVFGKAKLNSDSWEHFSLSGNPSSTQDGLINPTGLLEGGEESSIPNLAGNSLGRSDADCSEKIVLLMNKLKPQKAVIKQPP